MSNVKYLAEGVEYWKDEDTLLLLRCPKCHRENYAPNVAKGICTWCGYNARELLTDGETVHKMSSQ
jgi:ribosomal protein L37E